MVLKRIFVSALFMAAVLTGPAVFSLSLDEVLSLIDETYEVEFARLMVEKADGQLAAAGFAGDFSLNFDPSVKATTSEGGTFGETVSLTGSMGFKLPIGLSDAEKEKLRIAADSLDQALRALEEAKEKAFIKLYGLYQYAWLVQEENKILTSELEATRVNAAILRNLYEEGEVSLLQLAAAETDLEVKQEAVIRGNMERRISWLDLAYTVGLPQSSEILEKGELSLNDLPFPQELVSWAIEHNNDVDNQMIKIRQLEDSISRVKGQDFSIDIKTFLNIGDHSASITYDFNDPALSGSYSFPLYSFSDPSSLCDFRAGYTGRGSHGRCQRGNNGYL
jgi:outer membrane protein TolC